MAGSVFAAAGFAVSINRAGSFFDSGTLGLGLITDLTLSPDFSDDASLDLGASGFNASVLTSSAFASGFFSPALLPSVADTSSDCGDAVAADGAASVIVTDGWFSGLSLPGP